MKAETFKGVQRELGLTNKKMSTVLGVSLRTVEKWRQGSRSIPGPAEVATSRPALPYSCICALMSLIILAKPGHAGQSPKKPKKGWRIFPPSSPRLWDIGLKIGEQLRNAQSAERGPAGERFSPAPHLRRAHWHTYRVGPGRMESRLRWLSPTLVGHKK